MDLSDLPPELVEEIASYLSVNDILACSSVNLQWEYQFNLESIWKKFPTHPLNYFENQTSKLNYSPNHQLEPCPSKKVVFKELFVKENFLSGRYHTEEINIGASYCDCIKEFLDREGNQWLFVSIVDGQLTESQHRIQVWSLNDSPRLHSCSVTPLGETRRLIDSQIIVVEDRVYYIHENLALAYEFVHPKYEFKFLHKIEFSKSQFPAHVSMLIRMVCLPNVSIGFAYADLHIHQHLPPSYEIWGTDSSPLGNNFNQVDFQNVGPTSFPLMYVKKNDLNNVIVVYEFYVRDSRQFNFVVNVFDSKKLEYTDFSVRKAAKLKTFDVSENVVTLLYTLQIVPNSHQVELHIETYDVESGSRVLHNCIPFNLTTQLILNEDLLVTKNRFLYVYCSTGSKFSHVRGFQLAKKPSAICAFQNSYLIIEISGMDVVYEVYDYKTATKMYDIKLPKRGLSFRFKKKYPFPSIIVAKPSPNTSYTQHISQNSIFVISFY